MKEDIVLRGIGKADNDLKAVILKTVNNKIYL
jgi:hypothetical protein